MMGTDIDHDEDCGGDQCAPREQAIHLAGIKAMMLASSTYGRCVQVEPRLAPMTEPYAGRWCDDHEGGID